MVCKRYRVQKGWLHLPIGRDARRYYVKVEAGGRQIAELYLGLAPLNPDFYCAMELQAYAGQTVCLTVEEGAPEGILDGWIDGDDMRPGHSLYPDLYRERLRPVYHFSSRRGWLNDPNGLVFDGASYHLYYQHNPYGITHGGVNIHWGHAVSTDGVCWEEKPDAIWPDSRERHIASGSAIVDRAGTAGYGKGTIIAAYTALGSRDFRTDPPGVYPSGGQCLVYSTDGGMRFHPFSGNPLIACAEGLPWRDPRIFEVPGEGFYIAVYETNERGNCVSFYRSDDLHRWTFVSAADDLYECPDLFALTPENGGEKRWVLYGADGMYRVGGFREGRFWQIGERRPLDYGSSAYAGQTWTGREDADGRMHISWVRDERLSWDDVNSYPDMPFSQCMSLPCLLTLTKTDVGYRLRRNPIPALQRLRKSGGRRAEAREQKRFEWTPTEASETLLDVQARQTMRLEFGNVFIEYNPCTRRIRFSSGKEELLPKAPSLSIRAFVDRTSVEFFIGGEISATFGMETAGKKCYLSSRQGMDVIVDSYDLSPIHP